MNNMKIILDPKVGKIYWGIKPLPVGAELLGLIELKPIRKGALIRLQNGIFVEGSAGSIRTLEQDKVEQALHLEAK